MPVKNGLSHPGVCLIHPHPSTIRPSTPSWQITDLSSLEVARGQREQALGRYGVFGGVRRANTKPLY